MDDPIAPRPGAAVRVAAAIGSIWGLATYGVLWESTPVEATRAFVDGNPIATLILLPSRIAIWAILGTARLLGRTCDLSTHNAWIAPAAALVGAGVASAAVAMVARTPLGRRHF